MNWIHQKGILDFNLMTNFNKSLREKLKEIAIIEPPKIIEKVSKFGKTFNQLTLDTVKAFLIDSKKSRFKI